MDSELQIPKNNSRSRHPSLTYSELESVNLGSSGLQFDYVTLGFRVRMFLSVSVSSVTIVFDKQNGVPKSICFCENSPFYKVPESLIKILNQVPVKISVNLTRPKPVGSGRLNCEMTYQVRRPGTGSKIMSFYYFKQTRRCKSHHKLCRIWSVSLS